MARQSDDAYDRLKADIVLCKLEPGTEHTEVELAQSYKMGRAAIRVALTRLGEIRLVQAVPRRGFVIAPITANSIRDLFETRLMIEPHVARLATGRVNVKALRKLNKPIPISISAENRLEFLGANHEFHMMIAEATGNVRLALIMEGLLDEMRRLINIGLFGPGDDATQDKQGKERQQDQHAKLIRAFVEADADAAERVAREHIERSYAMARERIFDRSFNVCF